MVTTMDGYLGRRAYAPRSQQQQQQQQRPPRPTITVQMEGTGINTSPSRAKSLLAAFYNPGPGLLFS
jgi:hypothetical protein